ncbi:hypothetical protein [Streptomyces katrae]|uniref:hypothetical protein n=1 Tax=Streptomyces katrae TaxID=68223 RepID=UPI0012FF32AC|nr:hypothetical protein [Streptomyces katrae]
MTYRSGARLLLVGAVAVLLLACTVAAWALPHTTVTAPAARLSASQTGERCARNTGSVHELCPPDPAAPVAVPHPSTPAVAGLPWLDARAALLLFSTAAVAAAIALASVAGRRL